MMRGALAHATWLVDAREDSQKATAQDVVGYYNQSRVGLCLSRKEGRDVCQPRVSPLRRCPW